MGQRFVEWLERRLFLSATDPSADEQQTLELINRMRQNPAAELPLLENSSDPGVIEALKFFNVNLTTLASQWATLVPAPPLAWNTILAGTALAHDQLMLASNVQSHQLTGEMSLPDRVNAAGYDFEFVGESIFIAATSVFEAHAAFAIDWGSNPPSGIQNPPGHRENIMDPSFNELGIAFLDGSGDGDGKIAGPLVVTEDFGSLQTSDGPFLLGSAFTDANGDGFYTAGEGMAGITVQAVGTGGTFTTTTLTAGGYQMAVTPGTYTVTFSGGPLAGPSVFNNVVVGADNVQLDLDTGSPHITSLNTATFTAGVPATFTVTTNGMPPMTLDLESGTLPTGLSFADNGDGTGTIGGTAALGTGGTYTLTLSAGNGVGSPAMQTFKLIVNQGPAFSSPSAGAFTIGAVSTFSITTTGSPNATITHTGTLPGGILFSSGAGGTATLHGAAFTGTVGTYVLTLTATNSVGSVQQTFSLTVNQAPAFTSLNHVTVQAGAFATFGITTSGFPAASITEMGALPSGAMLIDEGNGKATLGGTYGATTGGAYAVTLMAQNITGVVGKQVFTLTVDQAPAIGSAASDTFTVGTGGTLAIATTGFPAPTVSEIGVLPAGVLVRNTGGGNFVLAGTPGALTGKTYGFTLVASNGIGTAFKQPFTLTVDQAPAITSLNHATLRAGAFGTFVVTATGFPAPAITMVGITPTVATLTDLGTGRAILGGTFGVATGGVYVFSLQASNGVGTSAGQVFTLTVDQAPGITSGNSATFTVGTVTSFGISTSGFPNATVSEIGLLPLGVTLKNIGGGMATLGGKPAALTGKTYAVTLVAFNGIGLEAKQVFTLTVDQAPKITSLATTTFTTLKAFTFAVKASGFPAPVISVSAGLPNGVTLNGAGALVGQPAGDQAGSYAVTLTADNQIGTDSTQVFTLVVDQPPAISSANNALFQTGVANTITIQTTGFPAATIEELGLLPGGLHFTNNHNDTATLAGTPSAAVGGTYKLSIIAFNGIGVAAGQAFTLTVDQAAGFASLNHGTFTAGKVGTFLVRTSGFPAATLTETGGPDGLTFTDKGNGTGTLIGSLAKNTYTFTLSADNGIGSTASEVFTLIVT